MWELGNRGIIKDIIMNKCYITSNIYQKQYKHNTHTIMFISFLWTMRRTREKGDIII